MREAKKKRRIRIKIGPLKPYQVVYARLIERMGWALEVEEWKENGFTLRRFIARKGRKELSDTVFLSLLEKVKETEKG